MRETKLWEKLRDHLPPGHFSRVENPTDPGTPDVSFCTLLTPGGLEGWIELKYCEKLPMTDEHGVRKDQMIWIERRLRAGGLVIIAVGIPRMTFFTHGMYARVVNSWVVDDFAQHSLIVSRLTRPLLARAFREIPRLSSL